MDYYGAQCYKCIRKNRRIDNIEIAWNISILFFVFNFQSIIHFLLIIMELLIPQYFPLKFYMNHLDVFGGIYVGMYGLSFLGFYLYIEKNNFDKKINPYSFKDKVVFYDIYFFVSAILLLIIGFVAYKMMSDLVQKND
jgi:hypothetical protein